MSEKVCYCFFYTWTTVPIFHKRNNVRKQMFVVFIFWIYQTRCVFFLFFLFFVFQWSCGINLSNPNKYILRVNKSLEKKVHIKLPSHSSELSSSFGVFFLSKWASLFHMSKWALRSHFRLNMDCLYSLKPFMIDKSIRKISGVLFAISNSKVNTQ